MIEQFMIEVFEKAKKDSGATARDAVIKHIQTRIDEILVHSGDQPMSDKTLERYYRKYVEKQEEVSGFTIPNDKFKHQLAKYLGYTNYNEYTAHIHRQENSKVVNNNADEIINIDTMNGDININKKKDE